MSTDAALEPAAAFRRWAPVYADTPLSLLEAEAFRVLSPPLAGARLLDVGCGPAPRTCGSAGTPRLHVGVDLVREMLERETIPPRRRLVQGDALALPIADAAFDIVLYRLVLAYVDDAAAAVAELARVTAPGGTIVMTDMHPDFPYAASGRSFRDAAGETHVIRHHVHPVDAQLSAVEAAGLQFEGRYDLYVGPAVRAIFAAADGVELYESLIGRPLILGLRLRGPFPP